MLIVNKFGHTEAPFYREKITLLVVVYMSKKIHFLPFLSLECFNFNYINDQY